MDLSTFEAIHPRCRRSQPTDTPTASIRLSDRQGHISFNRAAAKQMHAGSWNVSVDVRARQIALVPTDTGGYHLSSQGPGLQTGATTPLRALGLESGFQAIVPVVFFGDIALIDLSSVAP
jgi:hypothetical protein